MGDTPIITSEEPQILHSNPLCVRCYHLGEKQEIGLFIYNGYSVCKECLKFIAQFEKEFRGPLPWRMDLLKPDAKDNTDTKE